MCADHLIARHAHLDVDLAPLGTGTLAEVPAGPAPGPGANGTSCTRAPQGRCPDDADRRRPGAPPAPHRDLVAVEPPAAATADDLFHRLNNQRPRVVHFSGQSSSTGPLLDGTDIHDPDGVDVDFTVPARLLKGTHTPLTVLNRRESLEGPDTLLGAVPAVVAMADETSEMAAKAFPVTF
ncbi:hypothetical protein V6U77_28800 [Micromonospora sp. CPCC 205546]|uniref:hypothetical protein n=1 Tax=Micromonospora sp. CPCC 205546 TaxID=3122397 RepID=UPI002FF40879